MSLENLLRELESLEAPPPQKGRFPKGHRVFLEVLAAVRRHLPALEGAARRLQGLDPARVEAWLEEALAQGGIEPPPGLSPEEEALLALCLHHALRRHLVPLGKGRLPREAVEEARVPPTYPYPRRCPICGGEADVAYLEGDGHRYLVCSRCDTRWLYLRVGCPACGNTDPYRLDYLPGERGLRLYRCHACGHRLLAQQVAIAEGLDLPWLRAQVPLLEAREDVRVPPG
ncbi:formate dehydrogenase accessory protein FdhE [Thermus thermamylovorans]|uniref:Formate dehydrogenase accessory protein FdhE n=1 Tax=Thermus thermamylovorans TaxID=2509362 RepID=A0A4Q9B5X4_9DEIN|nr:formate dehydrogenase accessory protein FdhE [Thermus thermamylovorans]TBH21033.1 formate dehydrogenase accessory protein FdhE [Thermus thermamylovorans]